MTRANQKCAVIIMAAGKGTRMRSHLPKVLHQLAGLSLLERTLRAARGLDPEQIVVVIGHEHDAVTTELNLISAKPLYEGITIDAVLQAEQGGTGHAAQIGFAALRPELETVFILPGDTPLLSVDVLKTLGSSFLSSQASLAFLTTHVENPSGFGRVIRDEQGFVLGVVEEKDCTNEQRMVNEINASLYAAKRAFLSNALSALSSDNAQGELYLTDIVGHGIAQSLPVEPVFTDEVTAVMGANTRSELYYLAEYHRALRCEELMEQGVSFEDITSVYIDQDVTIGQDCVIGAGTRLLGSTVISNGVSLEGDTLIRDSHIGEGATICLASHIESAEIGPQTTIGPFARIRPGTSVAESAKIGNFVETKNATLHRGSKVGHLSYVGDAEVGAEANIGAGTITCNYDGEQKHRTSIGQRSFIGSNTALVAPVSVGDGAFVGAGSTITADVPAGALGVARGRQKNLEHWVARRKRGTS